MNTTVIVITELQSKRLDLGLAFLMRLNGYRSPRFHIHVTHPGKDILYLSQNSLQNPQVIS